MSRPRQSWSLCLVLLVAAACGSEDKTSDRDGALALDATVQADAGAGADAGPNPDASSGADVGTEDGGANADSGTGADAGTTGDAGSGGDSGAVADAGSNPDASSGPDAGSSCSGTWSSPQSLVESYGRLAIGNRVHVVGHLNGQLVHRSSQDQGLTWSAPNVIASASGNYPGMYGGLFAQGDTVYLLTAPDDMASSATAGGRQLDFRRSIDNGVNWSSPVRITTPGQSVFRVRIAASGDYVHVAGAGDPLPDGSVLYFRSVNGGVSWDAPVVLASNLGEYGGGQTVAVDGATVHVAYTTAMNGVGGGPTSYIRSVDNGETWSSPVSIGEASMESSRQARVQIAAAGGRVFAIWQREGEFTGAPVPPDRIGYNRSLNGGVTWETAEILPEDTGVNRNHQHVWMTASGGVHVLWRIGNSNSDPAGYMYSGDYGATWGPSMEAINTGAINHPWNIVADDASAHVITGPDTNMQYASRCIP